MVVLPEPASGEYQQKPGESKRRFLERIQRVAGKNYKRGGSIRGSFVGYMTRKSWNRYCKARNAMLEAKRTGKKYKYLPKPETTEKIPDTDLVRVKLNITGIASLGRSFKYFT